MARVQGKGIDTLLNLLYPLLVDHVAFWLLLAKVCCYSLGNTLCLIRGFEAEGSRKLLLLVARSQLHYHFSSFICERLGVRATLQD